MKLKSKKREGVETYQCPMRCEGDKAYDHPGNCPVCNMKLVIINQ
jgi:transcription initiation factor IIE alpha subunit